MNSLLRCEFDDGRVLRIAPNGPQFIVEPLSFEELENILRSPTSNLTVQIKNAVVNFDSYGQLNKGTCYEISTSIDWHHPIEAFCLVPNGWLSLMFPQGKFLIPDRNLKDAIKGNANLARAWHAQLIRHSNVRLNPIFCALECNKARIPSLDEFVTEYENCVQLFKDAMPNLTTIVATPEKLTLFFERFAQPFYEDKRREINFLLEVQPNIKKKQSLEKLNETVAYVKEAAVRHNVDLRSMCFMLTLAYIYEPRDLKHPFVSKVMKLNKDKYAEKEAYNSLMDLSALEVLSRGNLIPSEGGACFATSDKWLAMLWCATAPHDFLIHETYATLHANISSHLFPSLSEEERMALLNSLEPQP